jgi:hypothetical protein
MKRTEMPPISEEDKMSFTASILAEGMYFTFIAFEDTSGTETVLERIRPYVRNSGIAFATNMKKMFNIEGDGIHQIALVNELGNLFIRNNAKEIEHTDDRIVYVASNCGWYPGSASPGMCKMQHMWFQYMTEAINPDYENIISQMISMGDPVCTWIIQKKKK